MVVTTQLALGADSKLLRLSAMTRKLRFGGGGLVGKEVGWRLWAGGCGLAGRSVGPSFSPVGDTRGEPVDGRLAELGGEHLFPFARGLRKTLLDDVPHLRRSTVGSVRTIVLFILLLVCDSHEIDFLDAIWKESVPEKYCQNHDCMCDTYFH